MASQAIIAHTMVLPEKTWRSLCDGLEDYIYKRDPGATVNAEVCMGARASGIGLRYGFRDVRPHASFWNVQLHSLKKVLRLFEEAEVVRKHGKPYRRIDIPAVKTRVVRCAIDMARRTRHFAGRAGKSKDTALKRHDAALRVCHKLSPLEKLARQA